MTPVDAAVAAPKKLMTVDEYWGWCQLPENADRRTELIRGEIVEMSRPRRPHGTVITNVILALSRYVEARGLGYLTTDSGVVLEDDPGTVVGPDVAYFTDANTFEDIPPKWGEEVPVLAVEVLSPTDKMSQVNAKIRDYLNSGVKIVWLVDYEERSVTVYRPNHHHDTLPDTAELSGGDDLPGLSCRIADFFRLAGSRQLPPSA